MGKKGSLAVFSDKSFRLVTCYPNRLNEQDLDASPSTYSEIIQLWPTPEEMAVKENTHNLFERLIKTIESDSRLAPVTVLFQQRCKQLQSAKLCPQALRGLLIL